MRPIVGESKSGTVCREQRLMRSFLVGEFNRISRHSRHAIVGLVRKRHHGVRGRELANLTVWRWIESSKGKFAIIWFPLSTTNGEGQGTYGKDEKQKEHGTTLQMRWVAS